MPPEVMWLQFYGVDDSEEIEPEFKAAWEEVTHCREKVFDTDVKYVRDHLSTKRLCELQQAYVDFLEGFIMVRDKFLLSRKTATDYREAIDAERKAQG